MKKFYIFLIIFMGVVMGGILGGNFEKVLAENSDFSADSGSLEKSESFEDLEFSGKLPEFFIKAVNPGYTVDGKQNVGEMIEIGRKNSDHIDSLAGLNIGYINSSGNTVALADLSKYIWKAGETIYLQLASSPDSELAQVRYLKTLALKAGPLVLMREDEVLDSVCWTGKNGCYAGFDSNNPTTLVRNLETGDFEHLSSYSPTGDGILEYVEDEKEMSVPEAMSVCKGVEFSEILSYYESLQSEQFIELYNSTAEMVRLDGCFIKYKNKLYSLTGMVAPEGYFVRTLSDFKLTKNPTTSNLLELIDADGVVLDKLEYPNGQRKGAAYAFVGYGADGAEIWRVTYAPTPGEANNYQEFKTCEVGKVINELTGNCVKAVSLSEKICPAGQYLNILTGRCRKNPTNDTNTKVCKEGYYLSEETGRCRKIVQNDGADFALVPETYTTENNFVGLYLVLGVVGVGVIYIIYEFRHEIMKLMRRLKK